MDALRQSMMRAQLGKPLPKGIRPAAAQPALESRASDMATINEHFSTIDKKLDTLIHLLKGPDRKQGLPRHLVPADVRRVVTEFFGVAEQAMSKKGRSGRIAMIRQIAYYLCRVHTSGSLPEIGQAFGDRDHTTILHGVRRIGSLRERDAALDDDLTRIERRLAELLKSRAAA
jgi:chromosomal replication initiation ATPase DnaA